MTYVKWQLVHIPFVSNTWQTASSTILADFTRPMVTKALGTSKDSFSFDVVNVFGDYDNFFKPNDKLEIYRVTNTETVTTADLLMVGTISIPSYSVDERGDTIKVQGYSFSEYVLRALTNVDAKTTTIPYAIKQGLEYVGGQTGGLFNITWHPSNPMVNSTGGAFPVINESWFKTPLYTKIEKWSTSQATKDGNYYFYVDRDNKFVWFRGDNSTSKSFNSTTAAYKSLKHDVDKEGIVNWIVAKGGIDPAGKPIEAIVPDPVSYAKYGQKPYLLISEKNKAEELVKTDYDSRPGVSSTNYPDLSTSFQTTWYSQVTVSTVVDGVTMTPGQRVTINKGTEAANKNAYTAIIRKEIEARLRNEATQYMQDIRLGKLELDIEFGPNEVDWQLGDRVTVTIPSIRSTPMELRVHNIQYTTEADTFSLKQDIGSI
jgi:hypothetical protein